MAFSANVGLDVYYVVVDSTDTLLHLYDLQTNVYGDNASSIDYYCGFNVSDMSKSETIVKQFQNRYEDTQTAFEQQAGSGLENGSETFICQRGDPFRQPGQLPLSLRKHVLHRYLPEYHFPDRHRAESYTINRFPKGFRTRNDMRS